MRYLVQDGMGILVVGPIDEMKAHLHKGTLRPGKWILERPHILSHNG